MNANACFTSEEIYAIAREHDNLEPSSDVPPSLAADEIISFSKALLGEATNRLIAAEAFDADRLAIWLSASFNDHARCDEYRTHIKAWIDAQIPGVQT